MAQMNKRLWKTSYQLAAGLSQLDCDPNLLREAEAYVKLYPDADMFDWLERLDRLGDALSSSEQTQNYRHKLWYVCNQLQWPPQSGGEWALVLAWAARLFDYFSQNPRLGERELNLNGVDIGLPPAPYVAASVSASEQAAELDIPEVPDDDEVSDKAEDMFAKMQKLWGDKGDK